MTIRFDCTGCGTSLKVKDEKAGRKTRCPSCDMVLQVPEVDVDEDWKLEDGTDEFPSSRSKRSSGSSTPRDEASTSKKKSKRKAEPAEGFAGFPAWAVVTGCSVLALLSLGVGGMLGLKYGNNSVATVQTAKQDAAPQGADKPDAVVQNNGKKAEGKKAPQYVVAEAEAEGTKYKLSWEMPPKWTQQSGLEDGKWPWFHLKGQGQEIRLASNRSFTENSTTMTSLGGPKEKLMTAHTVRLQKLEAENTDYTEERPQTYDGKYGPVIWCDFEYKGVFAKAYGTRCTIVGPTWPCSLRMECSLKDREKWRPLLLYVAGSVHFPKAKKAKVPGNNAAAADEDDDAMEDAGDDKK